MRNKVYNFNEYSDGLKNNEFETSSLSQRAREVRPGKFP